MNKDFTLELKASSMIGLPIMTLDEGKEIANVEDVLFNPEDSTIVAFLVDEKGWFKGARVLYFSNIKSIGKDKVMIQNNGALEESKDEQKKIVGVSGSAKGLKKIQVITQEGNVVGNVSDFTFLKDTGAIQQFTISQGMVENIKSGKKKVHVSNVVRYGKEGLIVNKLTETEITHQKDEQGLTGAVHTIKEKVSDTVESIKESETQNENIDTAKEGVAEIKEKTQDLDEKEKEPQPTTKNAE